MACIATHTAKRVIVGLGQTGLSCVRYCVRQGWPCTVMDSRAQPPGLAALQRDYPHVPVLLGGLDSAVLRQADELVISPGLSLAEPAIAHAIAAGAHAMGDIELFCRAIGDTPVVAITGTNGKSTVTTLLGAMAQAAGVNVAIGGNLGTPALDLLASTPADLYILELSSFQLETTQSLRATAATILNITPDHGDRYATLTDYQQAKQRIYQGCQTAVYYQDDPLTVPLPSAPVATMIPFTDHVPATPQTFGLQHHQGAVWLSKGTTRLFNTTTMRLGGQPHYRNALAALALGEAVGLERQAMVTVLPTFAGLPHRCQWLAEIDGVRWLNDSKATNVGASVAAIRGVGTNIPGKIVLIAGGVGKDADFSALQAPVAQHVKAVILIGQAAPVIGQTLDGCTTVHYADGMAQAVTLAQQVSRHGDAVLLAPACASFDQFTHFAHRGAVFSQQVQALQ